MKRILWSLLILVALAAGGCGYSTSVNGTDTGGGTTSPIAALDLSATKLTLDTNGTDSITFTVFAKTAKNAAASAATIAVESTGGILTTNSLTTDTDGQATFNLLVGTEKANRQIVVTLKAGSIVKTQTITIRGTTLVLTASKFVTTPSDPAPIELTATLRDAGNIPISGATINFSSVLGNTFIAAQGYAFTTGTDNAGVFKARYSGAITGDDTVTVASSGATASVNLTNNAASLAFFGFTAPADQSIVNVSTTQPLTVVWLDADGNPVIGEELTFSAGKGYFGVVGTTSTTATTDGSGSATVLYSTGATAGPVQITAADSTNTQTATLTLQVHATTPASIDLQVNPGVLPVSTATTTATATLKATVRDANHQAVAGKVVGFSILQGPGGGEFISPVTAITDNGGLATSTFTSGSLASAQNGVEILATVQGGISDNAFMTIAQKAATVSIGTTNKLETVESTGYKQPFIVLVTNSSGGAVAGATVTLSLAPIRFYLGVGGESITYTGGVYVAEDTNRNYILDVGEDCAIELDLFTRIATGNYWQSGSSDVPATIIIPPAICTGNGLLDPGAVASVDPTVTTGVDGMATFYVYYPKSSGNWVDVEITASTDVTGTNASAKIETNLNVIKDDKPYLSSPFGF